MRTIFNVTIYGGKKRPSVATERERERERERKGIVLFSSCLLRSSRIHQPRTTAQTQKAPLEKKHAQTIYRRRLDNEVTTCFFHESACRGLFAVHKPNCTARVCELQREHCRSNTNAHDSTSVQFWCCEEGFKFNRYRV